MNYKKEKIQIVNSVDRAIKILKCFSIENTELSLSEISKSINLPKSTTHRLLHTLKNEHFIEQDEINEKYRLGYEIVRLSVIAREANDLRKIAIKEMKWVTQESQETCNLYVVKNFHRLCIEQVPGPLYIRTYSYLGALLPLYCGASGKLLLAYMDDQYITDYFDNVELEKLTDNTITDKEALMTELIRIRNQGYAVSIAERETITASVSTPIFNCENKVIAALTISGHVSMFTDKNIERHISILLEASKKISMKLGYKI